MKCRKTYNLQVVNSSCEVFENLIWGVPTYNDSGGQQIVTGSWLAENFEFQLNAIQSQTPASAANSATVAVTSGAILVTLRVNWNSSTGTGLIWEIEIGTTNFGTLFTVDQDANAPAYNTEQFYTFGIPETSLDTLYVNVFGAIAPGWSIPTDTGLDCTLSCVPAFGNTEQSAHAPCPGVGCDGPGGDFTVAANFLFALTQAEADANALALAQSEADSQVADPLPVGDWCCCGPVSVPDPWDVVLTAPYPGTVTGSANGLSGSFTCNCTYPGGVSPQPQFNIVNMVGFYCAEVQTDVVITVDYTVTLPDISGGQPITIDDQFGRIVIQVDFTEEEFGGSTETAHGSAQFSNFLNGTLSGFHGQIVLPATSVAGRNVISLVVYSGSNMQTDGVALDAGTFLITGTITIV